MAVTGNKNLLERKCDKKVMTRIAKDRTRTMLKALGMSLYNKKKWYNNETVKNMTMHYAAIH